MERAVTRDYTIDIQACPMGEDWVFLIQGGKAHIGASVVAYPGQEEVVVKTIALPGHREEQLAAEMARLAASKLHRTAAVIMGIHIDQASKEEIAEIEEAVHRKMTSLLLNMPVGPVV